jgi:PelA/Pel-15E family pectate lyase
MRLQHCITAFSGIALTALVTIEPANAQPAPTVQLPPLELVTEARIDSLPVVEQSGWRNYLQRSRELAGQERIELAAELKQHGLMQSVPAPGNKAEFEVSSKRSPAWYSSDEAKHLVTAVLSYQTPSGGWSKAVDYSQGPRKPGTHWTTQSGRGWHYCGTLDNRSTTEQIRFLATYHAATNEPTSLQGAMKGLEWLLLAQFPNGGWPQVFPLEPGYHEAITLNDDAMLHAMEILTQVSRGEAPFEFAPTGLRARARTAVSHGIDCLLRCQVIIGGQRTVWCAQHDPLNLRPVAARLKEPPSLSGGESASVLKFLMHSEDSPTIRESITGAVDWFNKHKLTGLRRTKNAEGKTDYVEDPESIEIYWARFYDLETERPIFAGAQDGVIYTSFSEMAKHNKVAYDYFTTRPRDVVTKDLQQWRKRVGL